MFVSSFSQPVLAGYLVEFNYVVPGSVETQKLHITNHGELDASFTIENHQSCIFSLDCDRVTALPPKECIDVAITFSSRPDTANHEAIKGQLCLNVCIIMYFKILPEL